MAVKDSGCGDSSTPTSPLTLDTMEDETDIDDITKMIERSGNR